MYITSTSKWFRRKHIWCSHTTSLTASWNIPNAPRIEVNNSTAKHSQCSHSKIKNLLTNYWYILFIEFIHNCRVPANVNPASILLSSGGAQNAHNIFMAGHTTPWENIPYCFGLNSFHSSSKHMHTMNTHLLKVFKHTTILQVILTKRWCAHCLLLKCEETLSICYIQKQAPFSYLIERSKYTVNLFQMYRISPVQVL